jgi:hypothetical protein
MRNPFRYFNSSPEVIRLTVMMYIRYPLSLRQVEDLLFERGIDICHETVRFWWNRFGPLFAAEIRKRRVHHRSYSQWRWYLAADNPATIIDQIPNCMTQRLEAAEGRRSARPAPRAESKAYDMHGFPLACLTLDRRHSAFACAGKGEVIQGSNLD